MAAIHIEIIVAADPTENVHSSIKADSCGIWEVGPMLKRAIADLQAELDALSDTHWPAPSQKDRP